jgi:hypothetical protein
MVIYLLDVNVYEDADEKDWCDGVLAAFQTQQSAIAYFDDWLAGTGFDINRREVAPSELESTPGFFVGEDTSGFDGDVPIYMSWGINTMEVRA